MLTQIPWLQCPLRECMITNVAADTPDHINIVSLAGMHDNKLLRHAFVLDLGAAAESWSATSWAPAVYRHYKKYKWVKDLTVHDGM